MFKNYFFLKRCAFELNKVLQNKIILEAYTQERDKIYFSIANDKWPNRHFVISTDPMLPYLLIKESHFKAKRNRINFYNEYLPAEIKQIDIASNDRILRITLNSSKIYFLIRGNGTNVLLVDNEGKVSIFKKSKKYNIIDLRNEVESLVFVNASNEIQDKPDLITSHISKEISLEVNERMKSLNNNDSHNIQKDVVSEIFKNKIAIFYDDYLNRSVMCPSSFITYSIPRSAELFYSYNDALSAYLSIKFKNEALSKVRIEIERYVSRELEKLSSKINVLQKRINDGSKEKLYKSYGNLLLANRDLIKKGMKEISLQNDDLNEKTKINLDPKITPQKNIDFYFDKSRDEKINFNQAQILYEKIRNKYKFLLQIKTDMENPSDLEKLNNIKKKLKLNSISKPEKNIDEKIKYRHFLIEGKYHVFVGKDNVNNDMLTTKLAKQNDLWFHARGVSGSHVVLRVENLKESIPKNIIKNVASIAAFYSKSKTSNLSPVSYTLRKYVHKRKGLEPGKVFLSKEDVVIVKPEIPKNCELLDQ